MKSNLSIQQINIKKLKPAAYNPRTWNEDAVKRLTESIKQFGLVDPFIVNSAPERNNIVIGGHFRLKVAKDLGFSEIPVIYLNIPDIAREKELNLRLNKAVGDWNWELLSDFDESLLEDIGFSSEEGLEYLAHCSPVHAYACIAEGDAHARGGAVSPVA